MRLRQAGISWRRTGEEIVVLDLHGAEYFALNPSGALLWEALAEADLSAAQLEARLQQRYGIDAASAAGDLAGFLATLRGYHLLDGA